MTLPITSASRPADRPGTAPALHRGRAALTRTEMWEAFARSDRRYDGR